MKVQFCRMTMLAVALAGCCTWGGWKDPELAAVQAENRFPWANEIDYLISFKVDPDFSSFDDSSYLFLGITWELKEGGSRRDPANQQWRIPLKAADFAAPQLINGRKFYRITIDPLKNDKLYAHLMSNDSKWLMGVPISIGLFRANDGDEKNFYHAKWNPYAIGHCDSLVNTRLCPTPKSHTISGGIAQVDDGTKAVGRPFAMVTLANGRVASRMPVWVSPTAWGADPNSTQATVTIARLNADGTDTGCEYLPMASITGKTVVTDCDNGLTAPGFYFWKGANTPKVAGTYRLKMTTNGFKPTTICTEFTFTGLPKAE